LLRNNVTDDLWNYTSYSLVLYPDIFEDNVTKRLELFENELISAMRSSGWDGDEDLNSQQWTFTGALFYSIIVITTIGKYV